MILYVNACVRKDSRTKRLADLLLKKLVEKSGDSFSELVLESVSFPLADEKFIETRDALKASGAFEDPMFDMARQFAEADTIIIAAPFWDLSFPAMLKQYFEQINVCGTTFMYTPEGRLEGICKADKLYYVTTAGGDFCPEEFGYGYVEALAQNFYGIQDVKLIKATGLDIAGADVEKIMSETISAMDMLLN